MDKLPPCYRCGSQPCECKDGITLYCGDARDVLPLLPEGSVSALVTDPVWPNCTVPLAGSDRALSLFEEFAERIPITVKRLAIHLGCDTDPMILACLPVRLKFFRVTWLEYVRPHYKGRLLYTSDVAYLYGGPPVSRVHARVIPGRHMSTNPEPKTGNSHPCPRKLDHVRWLVKWWTETDDVVLDPFAGSGTTGRACKDLGRKCIQVEIEEKYCEIAANRLAQEVLFSCEAQPEIPEVT